MDSTLFFLVILFAIMIVVMLVVVIVNRLKEERNKITVPKGFYHLVMRPDQKVFEYGPGERYTLRACDKLIVLEGTPSDFKVSLSDCFVILMSAPPRSRAKMAVTAHCRLLNVRTALSQEKVSEEYFDKRLRDAIEKVLGCILLHSELEGILRHGFGAAIVKDAIKEKSDVLSDTGAEIISISLDGIEDAYDGTFVAEMRKKIAQEAATKD